MPSQNLFSTSPQYNTAFNRLLGTNFNTDTPTQYLTNAASRGLRARTGSGVAAESAARQFREQTGLGAGTAGGGAQTSLLRLLGASKGYEAEDAINSDAQKFAAEQEAANKDRSLQALQAATGQETTRLGQSLDYDIGQGQLGIERSRVSNEMTIANRNRDADMARIALERELGLGRLGLDRDLGTGQLKLGEGRLGLDRDLGMGELRLGEGRLGLDRTMGLGRLGLDRELGLGDLSLRRDELAQRARAGDRDAWAQLLQSAMGGAGTSDPQAWNQINMLLGQFNRYGGQPAGSRTPTNTTWSGGGGGNNGLQRLMTTNGGR